MVCWIVWQLVRIIFLTAVGTEVDIEIFGLDFLVVVLGKRKDRMKVRA